MDKAAVTLQVFFEDPFWVGIFERVSAGKLEACKVTFGPEPKDYEVLDFIRKGYFGLRFSPAVEATVKSRPASPKRMQREARREVQNVGIGTKSQQALSLQDVYKRQDLSFRCVIRSLAGLDNIIQAEIGRAHV